MTKYLMLSTLTHVFSEIPDAKLLPRIENEKE